MEEQPFVSIIVPVYNGEVTIEACIRSLLDLHYPGERYEILVVDNNSTDNTAAIIKKHPVRYLVEGEIQSSYAARNRGIREARGEILAFTDADAFVDKDWLTKGLKCLKIRDAHMVAGHVEVVTSEPPNLYEKCDRYMFLHQERSVRLGFGGTSNLQVKREVFEDIGLLDGRLISGGDYEFGRRATRRGYRVVHCAEARVYHPARATLNALLEKSRRIGHGRAQVVAYGKEPTPYHWLLRSALPPLLSLARGFDLSPRPSIQQQVALFLLVYCNKLFALLGYVSRSLARGEGREW